MYSVLLDIVVEKARKKESKSKHSLKDLENTVKNSYYNDKEYVEAGGYIRFFEAMTRLESEGIIEPVRASNRNNRLLSLHETYWIFGTKKSETWSDSIIFMLCDEINIDRYRSLPFLQTKENLERLKAVYRFMKTKHESNWLDREERSLMLFGDEKFLGSNNGKAFLNRIHLTLSDLKVNQPQIKFKSWKSESFSHKSNVTVLITEGQATYNTFEKQLRTDSWCFDKQPDLLIFGKGTGIHTSFPYIDTFIEGKQALIRYCGDIDPSGLNIFHTLINRYPDYNIQLADDIYQFMLQTEQSYPQITNQLLSRDTENRFKSQPSSLYQQFDSLFLRNKRIPQEVINFDTIYGGG
ncbi:Wadjet anti-phage system protein JetD domain-containing protein [Peribacillus frigoritolerans]|uniref:Wadjet anti-phage system protein JetD domain-containing protein n=1 Tax=Peribacillus frigoritolerans TaxID=450367 RepID=UPI003D04D4F9